MAKILPFDILKTNTLILDSKLNTDTGRYDIFGNAKPENCFDLWMKRVEQVTKCDTTGWKDQCDVFKILINDLKSINKEEDGEKGTLILVGALLHRYFRIIAFYENTFSESISYVTSFFSKPRTPLNSNFFLAIRVALQFEAKVKYSDFQKKDLAKLDVVTIVDSLTYFHDYMIAKDDNSQPQYEKYEHFKFSQDPSFVTNLEDIIEQYSVSKEAHHLLNQYKAIRFIKSLAKHLDADNQAFDKVLDAWVKILSKEYPDFSQLDDTHLEKHLDEHVKSAAFKQKIKILFFHDSIQSQIDCLDPTLFLEQMKKLNLSFASFNLYGGYALLLQSSAISQALKVFMLQALDIEKDPSENTDEDMLDGIESLSDYVKSNPDIKLDWSFFGAKKGFETLLSNAIVSLIAKPKKEEEGKVGVTLI